MIIRILVEAFDPDAGVNGTITYSLTSIQPRSVPPYLRIDPVSGIVHLTRAPPADWIGRKQLEAEVLAQDGGGKSATIGLI
ncbi:unnamed protein product [Protopolystoma xenopodis]|uniref:Cadherin domain-containing protein n=1 Tax=Protopolystoma xenopodis TaxID=117903 RepID=A0A3S5CLB0_9PLAT|nr:unnamed protein product [Protopolystoma xenopodis]